MRQGGKEEIKLECLRYGMGMKILIQIFFFHTRSHEVTLVKDQCRLDIMKYSFSQRTINEWNK